MATSSITKNFVIEGEEQVLKFIEAIEESAKNRPEPVPVSYHEIKGDEFVQFMNEVNAARKK